MEKEEEALAPIIKGWIGRKTPSILLPGRNNYIIDSSRKEKLISTLAQDITFALRNKKGNILIYGTQGIEVLKVVNNLLKEEEKINVGDAQQLFTIHGTVTVFRGMISTAIIGSLAFDFTIFFGPLPEKYEEEVLAKFYEKKSSVTYITYGEPESEEHIL